MFPDSGQTFLRIYWNDERRIEMRKLFGLAIALSLTFALFLIAGSAYANGMPDVVPLPAGALLKDLIAGQTDDVGDVVIWDDGVNLFVLFVMGTYDNPMDGDPVLDMHISDTHVYVGPDEPAKSSPGQYAKISDPKQISVDGGPFWALHTFPLPDYYPENNVIIVAHGVVETCEMVPVVGTLAFDPPLPQHEVVIDVNRISQDLDPIQPGYVLVKIVADHYDGLCADSPTPRAEPIAEEVG